MIGPFGLRPRGTMSARALPLARALARLGHRVKVVLPAWDWPADAGRVWHDAGVQVCTLPAGGRRPGRASPWLTWEMLRAALVPQPDVLHAFKPVGYAGMVALLSSLKPGRRFAVVVDMDDLEGRAGWAPLVSRTRLEAWLRDAQERWALRHADALTAASRNLREMALAAGMSAERVLLLRNGCEPAQPPAGSPAWRAERAAARRRLGLAGDEPALLWATRFGEANPRRAAGLIAALLSQRPDARLLIAGAGQSPEAEARFWDVLAGLNLSQREKVVSMGWLEPAAWRAVVLAADIGIMPLEDTAINRARCPAKAPQMLAWGLPLVAERVGEVTYYLADTAAGRLCPPGDEQAFVMAALDMLERRPAPRQTATLAAQWDWGRLAGELAALYECLNTTAPACFGRRARR